MPTSAVYQPTTVTYEQQTNENRWNCPISYFSRRVTGSLNRAVCLRFGLCILGSILFIIGLGLAITGGVEYGSSDSTTPQSSDNAFGTIIAGIVVLALGLLIIGAVAVRGRRGAGDGGAALGALNPSTDPLVARRPPDETRTLMDNRDGLSSAEESDKMLDGRPAIA